MKARLRIVTPELTNAVIRRDQERTENWDAALLWILIICLVELFGAALFGG